MSSWVRAEPGRSSLLECVVREPVEECLWMHQLSETQKLQEFTRFEPANFNNCSFNLPETEEGTSSGWWVCGARSPGDVNFTMASPTRVEFVERGQLNQVFASYTQYTGCPKSPPPLKLKFCRNKNK